MKKTPISKSTDSDEMRAEYDLDYKKARPNRFFQQKNKDSVVIMLDEDISVVFKNSESVNAVLRALITTMPKL